LNTNQLSAFKLDTILPHLGTLCGLSEDATAILLVEIGCLKQYNGSRTVIRRKGWDDLAAEFSVNDLIEVEKTELDRKEIWYIRLGLSNEVPRTLYKKWRDDPNHVFPPKSIIRQNMTAFVTTQMVETIRDSSFLDELLTSMYDATVGRKLGDDRVEKN